MEALDSIGGNEQHLKAVARRKLVQQARVAWQQDPQLGAAVDLMNDFALGRGVPRPKARDPEVQKVLDEAWEDEDNQLVLTSYPAQLALGTDLSLQANLFLFGTWSHLTRSLPEFRHCDARRATLHAAP